MRHIYKYRKKPKIIFDKNRKPKYFNCNVYRYIVKECKKFRKEKDTKKCYKYKQVGHITKDYRTEQKMKNQSILRRNR